ncbi:hypothetical protein Poli38472_005805 [Pythium oligandrum]|uniref:RPGR-interacting protein 1 first C2 domain-containing protein n=1 Tax=Pythium oligandrum TaxID=41045 RepID=A0A8K1CT77_PYTOL|nr:hypothetical protein Poli38472_005805 [Pythium oligandrum]|eukprot:TMW68337.1 hypothetical protein Poli38472_005805 [Pythium oligandrum]
MRRTPRKPTGVRASAPTTLEEPATGRTLSWPERYEHVLEANHRLNARLSQLETAHRKSLTVVKYEPSLPNNDVYTKELVEENRQLLQRYRQLELRLAQTTSWTSPSSRRGIGGRQDTKRWQKEHRLPIRDRATQTDASESLRVETQEATCVDEAVSLAVEEAKREERDREVRALLTEWRARLVELETDLERLRQENELLRAESRVANEENQSRTSNRPDETTKIEQEELTHALSDRVRQLAVLEARFAHLQDKAKAKTALYQLSVSKVEELNAALFDANQKLLKQAEWLQAHDDKHLQVDVLEKEVHLLRSENAKLNDAVATLSSRPLASWDAKLQEKTLLIAKLEAEQRELETEVDKLRQDHRVITQTNQKLRERVKTLTSQLEVQAQELAKAKAENERLAMERQVAELQLRFYLSGEGGDEQFMEAVGRALKEIKAGEKGGKAASRSGNVLQEQKLERCASCKATSSASLQKERLERISEVTKLIQEDAGAQLQSLRVTHAAEIRALKLEAKQWEQRASDYLTQISALQHERSSELRQERINKARGQSSKTRASAVPDISERLSTSRPLATFSDENVLEITILNLSLDQTVSARGSTQLVLICDYYDFESQLSPVLTLSESKVAVDFSITYKLLLDVAFARSPLAMHATIELHELQLGSSQHVDESET